MSEVRRVMRRDEDNGEVGRLTSQVGPRVPYDFGDGVLDVELLGNAGLHFIE